MSKIHICRNGVWHRVDSLEDFYKAKPRIRKCSNGGYKCIGQDGGEVWKDLFQSVVNK